MKIRAYTTLAFLSLSLQCRALPAEVVGKVVTIIDGNTIEFLSSENDTFKFVFAGIDCPELNQEFGDEARKHLEKTLKGKQATLIVEGKDRLGNRVGSIRLLKGPDPRIELLERGLAWTQEKSPIQEFENIKDEAKSRRIGLWRQENPIAPWIFRRHQSMLTPKMG